MGYIYWWPRTEYNTLISNLQNNINNLDGTKLLEVAKNQFYKGIEQKYNTAIKEEDYTKIINSIIRTINGMDNNKDVNNAFKAIQSDFLPDYETSYSYLSKQKGYCNELIDQSQSSINALYTVIKTLNDFAQEVQTTDFSKYFNFQDMKNDKIVDINEVIKIQDNVKNTLNEMEKKLNNISTKTGEKIDFNNLFNLDLKQNFTNKKNFLEFYKTIFSPLTKLSGKAYEAIVANTLSKLDSDLLTIKGIELVGDKNNEKGDVWNKNTTDVKMKVDLDTAKININLPVSTTVDLSIKKYHEGKKNFNLGIKSTKFGKLLQMSGWDSTDKNSLYNYLANRGRKVFPPPPKGIPKTFKQVSGMGIRTKIAPIITKLALVSCLAGSLTKEDTSDILIVNGKAYSIIDIIMNFFSDGNMKKYVKFYLNGKIEDLKGQSALSTTLLSIPELHNSFYLIGRGEGDSLMEIARKRSSNLERFIDNININAKLVIKK